MLRSLNVTVADPVPLPMLISMLFAASLSTVASACKASDWLKLRILMSDGACVATARLPVDVLEVPASPLPLLPQAYSPFSNTRTAMVRAASVIQLAGTGDSGTAVLIGSIELCSGPPAQGIRGTTDGALSVDAAVSGIR